uniref:Uncharacterized protein n=1 Tax=Tremella fuciformis TaxID=64657 RepID=D5KXY8_9TREE|nr:unknown [Tremella fuciformis]
MLNKTAADTSPISVESPPAYDFAPGPSVLPPAEGSSSHAQIYSVPKTSAHLFSSPPNAEDLATPPSPRVLMIETDTKANGQIILSHDRRLNDPRTLYDFLRWQALRIPPVKIHCVGAHTEIPERDEIVNDNGTQRHRKKGQMERVIDFDFFIDLSPVVKHENNIANIALATSRQHVPGLRGSHKPTYGALFAPQTRDASSNQYTSLAGATPLSIGRTTTRSENALWEAWGKWRMSKGLPVFAEMHEHSDFWDKHKDTPAGQQYQAMRDTLNEENDPEIIREANSCKALKGWCEAYCASPGMLKEFTMVKSVWGWDTDALIAAIKGAINSADYNSNDIRVTLDMSERLVIVKADNWLSRALSNAFFYAMTWLFLVYPIIWLWRRIFGEGRGHLEYSSCSVRLEDIPSTSCNFSGRVA